MLSSDRARLRRAAQRFEPLLIVLIAVHSYAVGAFLLLATEWGAAFGGWPEVRPLFFARQAGVFHVVVATGYLLEYSRTGGVTLLLMAKTTAVVFLGSMMLVETTPWAVPVSAIGDGLMGLVVLWVRHEARGMSSTSRRGGAGAEPCGGVGDAPRRP